jgi:serine/threonine protein kinase
MATEYIDGATLRQVLRRLTAVRDTTHTLDSLVDPQGDEEEKREIRFDLAPDEREDRLTLDDEDGEDDPVTAEAEGLVATKDYIRRCCAIVRDAAIALDHAHQRGVVHRDVKPENLMLDRQGGVHVIDFGVARFRDDVSLSSTGALVGTPMYMSPEHITGRVNIDRRSDIFSLGLVLYELLSLRCPYSATTREGILRQIVSKAMPPAGWQNRGVARDLEAVVHKAIARDPDERYQTAGEFAEDLQRFLRGEAVAAPPYRYRADEREIAAARPISAMIACIFYLFLSLFGFGSSMYSLADYDGIFVEKDPAKISAAAILWSLTMLWFWFAAGWFRGKALSILASAACNIIIVASTTFYLIMHRNSEQDIIIFIILNILFILTSAFPFLPQTRRWLRGARAIRSEDRPSRRPRP